MSVPAPLTNPDLGTRTHNACDLEKTLCKFLSALYSGARLDNPTLNFAQATKPTHPINPPTEFVSYDPTERAQTLTLKVSPRVVAGRIPRTVTGEVDAAQLANVPAVIVQVISASVANDETTVTVRMLFSAYDENPNSQGYQDVLNMIEAAAIALTQFGQGAIDQAYPIVMPIEWHLIESDCFPHFLGELTSKWELPSASPMPWNGDGQSYAVPIPGEHIELRAEAI
jgi:hypothetical protein